MNKRSNKPEPAKTVLTITTGFLVIYIITGWQWTIVTAICIGIAGIFSVRLSEMITWLWMKIAFVLGLIIPNVLLTLIFYLVLFPVALLSRIFRKDRPMILENREGSMFRDMTRKFGKEDFKNPW